jgi:hypothetical protein
MEEVSKGQMDPKDAKVIAEATEKAVNGIRTIRGLDEPEKIQLPEPLIIHLPAIE